MGQSISCFFFPSCEAFSASFILLANSSSVSSMLSNPSGGGLRLRDERMAGMLIYVSGFQDFVRITPLDCCFEVVAKVVCLKNQELQRGRKHGVGGAVATPRCCHAVCAEHRAKTTAGLQTSVHPSDLYPPVYRCLRPLERPP